MLDTEETVHQKLNHRNWITHWLPVFAALVIGLSFGAILYRSYVSGQQRKDTCRVALAVRDATVALLKDAQNLVVHTRTTPPEQRDQAIAFYKRNIIELNKVDCSTRGR